MKSILLAVFILTAGAASARAHDGDVDAVREIDSLYFHREIPGNLEKSIERSTENISRVQKLHIDGPESEYLWLRCRSLIRRGEKRSSKAEKLSDYESARKDCEAAVAKSSGSADAHFWLGVAMGRWGETKGILKAMFLIKPIRHEMEETLKLDPNHGGAHHVLGEMLWQVPGFAGGDKKKALAEFELAVKLSPTHTSNYQPLAEAYLKFDRKDDAIRTLKAVEAVKDSADPAEYAANLADARALLAKLGAK